MSWGLGIWIRLLKGRVLYGIIPIITKTTQKLFGAVAANRRGCAQWKGCRLMTIRDIRDLLSARILYGEELLDREIHTACGSDLMSDVLAFVKDQSVLLTGLLNPQVVRTAEMMDMSCIVFVRGKSPGEQIVDLARDSGIAVLVTDNGMFASCGKLYEGGLKGGLFSR